MILLSYFKKIYFCKFFYFKDLPKNNNGKRLLMVTTSLDDVNLYNKYRYIYEEGSYYTLSIRNNNKYY